MERTEQRTEAAIKFLQKMDWKLNEWLNARQGVNHNLALSSTRMRLALFDRASSGLPSVWPVQNRVTRSTSSVFLNVCKILPVIRPLFLSVTSQSVSAILICKPFQLEWMRISAKFNALSQIFYRLNMELFLWIIVFSICAFYEIRIAWLYV